MDGNNRTTNSDAPPHGARIEVLFWPFGLKRQADSSSFRHIPWKRFLVGVSIMSCVLNSGMLLFSLPQLAMPFQMGFALLALIAAASLFAILVLAIPCGLIYLLVPGSRDLGLRIIAGSAIFMGTFYAFASSGAMLRTAAFRDLADRSMPLIEAVKAFEANEGQLPESLEQLVPRYLEKVPSTGLAAYPKYKYLTGQRASFWLENPWVIQVDARRIHGFDKFSYFPLQNYPEAFDGHEFERMGAWAYLHE